MARSSVDEKIKKLNYASKVKIRIKKMKNNSRLYLDLYENRIHTYRFLDIYLTDDPNRNDLLIKVACEIRDKVESEITLSKNGIENLNKKEIPINFKDYAEKIISTKNNKTLQFYTTALNAFMKTVKSDIKILEITDKHIENFFKTIKSLKYSTQKDYLICLKHFFNQAIKDHIIIENPVNIKLKKEEIDKLFLNLDELNAIYQLEGDFNKEVKHSFLFACFTGLRISDIYKLTWNDIENGYLKIKQQKTNQITKMKLPGSAKEILLNQVKENDLIFQLPTYKYVRLNLIKIVKLANINKNITFHCARHTFATMCLTYDIDLFTVSKLLGHSNISTTQIYAKIIDKKKDEAIEKLPKI